MRHATHVFVEFRPLRIWPRRETPAGERKGRWSFKVTAGATLSELETELARHGARDAYLEVNVRSSRDIRADGRLRADASPITPGVILYYTHPVAGDLRFACDTYELWHHNVRGILFTLQDLRSIDRHGAVQDGAQFTGFRALPSATGLTMGSTAALRIFEEASGMRCEPRTPERLAEVYRAARAATHPDRTGGVRTQWDQVEAAARVLGVRSA